MNDEYLSLRDLFLDTSQAEFFYFLEKIQQLATSRGFKDLKECLDTPYEDGGIGMSIDQIKYQLRTNRWNRDEAYRVAVDLGLVDSPQKDRRFLRETYGTDLFEYPFVSKIHKLLNGDKNHVLTLDHTTYIFHIDIYVDGDFDLATEYKEKLAILGKPYPIFWCQRNGIDHAFLNTLNAIYGHLSEYGDTTKEQGFICHIHYNKKPSIQKDDWFIATDNGYEPVYKRKQALANGWPVDGSFNVVCDDMGLFGRYIDGFYKLPYYDAFDMASRIEGAKIVPSNFEWNDYEDVWSDDI